MVNCIESYEMSRPTRGTDDSESIWFGSRVNLLNPKQLDIMSLNLCSVVVKPVDFIHDLGVMLNSELPVQEHKSKMQQLTNFTIK